jgi:acetamidase/formamidase
MAKIGGCTHTIHGHQAHFGWDNSLKPALTVRPGESVEFEVIDASGGQLSKASTVEEVSRLDFSLSDWGWTAIIPGFGLLAEEFPKPYLKIWELLPGSRSAAFNDAIDIPLNPFPGTIGVAPADSGLHSVVPPRDCGGNLDIRHLTAGTTLFLPIQVEGALFSVGDTHAAQGDGEVCGTAVESPMQIALRFQLRRNMTIEQPQYIVPGPLPSGQDTKGYYVTTGIHADLMQATRKAVRAMMTHLCDTYRLSEAEAYALASVVVDLKINEVVDAPNWVVSAFLPQSIFKR